MFHFVQCTKKVHHEAIMKNYLKQHIWTGKKYVLHLRKVFVYIKTMFWIIFSFSISYFSTLKKGSITTVFFFATLWMKRRCISSILVTLQSDYGKNFNILFLSIFSYLKSHHRVPFSTTEFSINQSFTTHFQALFH